jgi:hypothetical protein
VADWIRSHEGVGLRVASTEIFEEFQLLISVRPGTRTAGRGVLAAAEVLSKELANREHGAILLYEDSDVRKQNFLVRLPDEILVTSTSEFLFGLESVNLVSSAREILERATDIRAAAYRCGQQSPVSATSGRSPRAPRRGRGEQLNDRFPAPSLGLSSA